MNTVRINYMQVKEYKKSFFYEFVKRSFDFIVSLIAFIILLPVFLIISIAIFIDDPHESPIFVQQRGSKGGGSFNMYKFRTMYKDADKKLEELKAQNEMDGPVFKIKNDPRITRIGKFLRKHSIDELLQLLNVIKGDMSIVGPRPSQLWEVEQYTEKEYQRLAVKPGLTCIWQIQPNRNKITFDEWLQMDLDYIQNRSFGLDLKLIFKTFKVVISGQGQ